MYLISSSVATTAVVVGKATGNAADWNVSPCLEALALNICRHQLCWSLACSPPGLGSYPASF